MTTAMNLGFSRIGARRELKRALESFWSGKSGADSLQKTAKELRMRHWMLQRAHGIASIPSNDFSLYDQVLDAIVMVGAVPERYDALRNDPLGCYFAMARGSQTGSIDVPAMEMTKWFDTNYHYIVPEFSQETRFALRSTKAIDEYLEAKASGIDTRPVLLGPVSLLMLGKMQGASPLTLLDHVLPVYEEMLARLSQAGARWVQLDEPMLVTDLGDAGKAFTRAYSVLRETAPKLEILLATYFGSLGNNLALAASLPVDGVHVDLVRGAAQLESILKVWPRERVLSLGVVDGRNVWRADLDRAHRLVARAAEIRGTDRLWVGPSCSLLHVPVDLTHEHTLDAELRGWLAFGTEKLAEINALAKRDAQSGPDATSKLFEESRLAVAARRDSSRVHDATVATRLSKVTTVMRTRKSNYAARVEAQRSLDLPLFPTTTIGSFPQTPEVRAARASYKSGASSAEEYDRFLREETERTIRVQEAIGLDVLVHGEFERNDMVEYFGERLSGFAFTENGWVQSYGSRCVKPPIIFGDVSRPEPMTVAWSSYAQSLTTSRVKGMLTGPVTILQWSFVRDDQPRSVTCEQIALAILDEVKDLEAAGIRIIQIDEPAIREGLPLRRAEWKDYLAWAIGAFRLASSSVRDETQIHTHMCYSEFNDIIDAVAAMDADVVSMETSRSRMELLDSFAAFSYPNGIGPGVYDIHSPRVPHEQEMTDLLRRAAAVINPAQLWVNPDCGLKTRRWAEVTPSLEAMVRAARVLRADFQAHQ
ncbi:MAG: 5-methyltetrahydropteroyltriglutamate--homocysteine S-methyltransferase [Gemmatimonadota bacterium]|nr:5-methyltetrahydropteroyltriglutamate--homocysteine S-methyltransferase [Gemmatimonadota bacterium]